MEDFSENRKTEGERKRLKKKKTNKGKREKEGKSFFFPGHFAEKLFHLDFYKGVTRFSLIGLQIILGRKIVLYKESLFSNTVFGWKKNFPTVIFEGKIG